MGYELIGRAVVCFLLDGIFIAPDCTSIFCDDIDRPHGPGKPLRLRTRVNAQGWWWWSWHTGRQAVGRVGQEKKKRVSVGTARRLFHLAMRLAMHVEEGAEADGGIGGRG